MTGITEEEAKTKGRELIKKALEDFFGPRCARFHPDCAGCQAWAAFDKASSSAIMAAKAERMRCARLGFNVCAKEGHADVGNLVAQAIRKGQIDE